MTTTLIIIAGILALLIVVVFFVGELRSRGKTFKKYEKLSSKIDNILQAKTEKTEGVFKKIFNLLNFNLKELIAWFFKFLLDLLHIITRKTSIRISKLRNKYHKKNKGKEIPSSPSEYLKEVGKDMDK